MKRSVLSFAGIALAAGLVIASTSILSAAPGKGHGPEAKAAASDDSGPLFPHKRDAVREFVMSVRQQFGQLRREHPLTAEQRSAIKDIIKQHHDDIVLQVDARVQAQRGLRAVVLDPSADEAAVRAASAKVAAVMADGAVLRHKIAAEISPLLTDDQRAAMKDLMAKLDTQASEMLGAVM